jgi:RNA polymerase sigma factor (sigma-70 family)
LKDEPQNTIDYYFQDINKYPGISHEELTRKLELVRLLSDNFICHLLMDWSSVPYYVAEWEDMIKSGKRVHKMSKIAGKTQLENGEISTNINREMKRARMDAINNMPAHNHIVACNFSMQVHYRVFERYAVSGNQHLCDYLAHTKAEIIRLQNEVAEANLKLVIKFAKEYQHVGVPLSDLIQEGNIGLMRAIEKFDPSKGLKFTTYAVWWIKQGFLKTIKSANRLIRIPTHIQETLSRINKTREAYLEATGFEPGLDVLAQSEGMTEEELETLYNVSMEPISIETVVSGEQAKQLKDFIPDTTIDVDKDIDLVRARSQIADSLDKHLTETEKEVIICRYGLFSETVHTLEEIAAKLDKSRERIRQIEANALRKLKGKAPWLEEYN